MGTVTLPELPGITREDVETALERVVSDKLSGITTAFITTLQEAARTINAVTLTGENAPSDIASVVASVRNAAADTDYKVKQLHKVYTELRETRLRNDPSRTTLDPMRKP